MVLLDFLLLFFVHSTTMPHLHIELPLFNLLKQTLFFFQQNKASYDVPPTFCMNNTTPLQSNIKAEENDTSKTIFQYPCPKCSKA